jgi:hypothetical protein
MIVRPWKKGDTQRLALQQNQQYDPESLNEDTDFSDLAEQGLALTFEDGEEVLMIAGLVPQWTNRAIAWTLISKNAGRHFVEMHRYVENFLNNSEFRRIESMVDVGFVAGHRWMQMLGFEVEGYMRAYQPSGADMVLYARIKQ